MKILITNIYSYKNKGDATIVLSAINGLKNKYNNPDIVLSTDDLLDKEKYGDYKVIPSFNRLYQNKYKSDLINNIVNLLNSIKLIVIFRVEKSIFKLRIRTNPFLSTALKEKLIEYREADIIFAIGGGYLLTNSKLRILDRIIGRASLHITCLEFYFSKAYNKPLVLLHQSIGPFLVNEDTKQVVRYLRKADLIVVRENYSYTFLKKNGIVRTLLKPDLAFSFNMSGISYFSKPDVYSYNYRVGITARQSLKKLDQTKYENELAKFIKFFLEKKKEAVFYFMPQVIYSDRQDNDLVVAKRIYSIIGKQFQDRCFCLDIDFSPQDLKATIGDCNLFIGTRMHSNIFALSNFVKTIAIAYEYKTTGIMEMLGLQNYTTTAEELNANFLVETLEKIENDVNYKGRLREKITHAIEETWNFKLPLEG